MLDLGLYIFYGLMLVAVLAAIGFALINAVKTPGTIVKTIIPLIALVVLFGLAYALSSGYVSNENRALGVTEDSSKLIGAGLILFYITLILSALALVYSEISKALK